MTLPQSATATALTSPDAYAPSYAVLPPRSRGQPKHPARGELLVPDVRRLGVDDGPRPLLGSLPG
jgi:hypothetical protein